VIDMQSVSTLIEFLMHLLRDEKAREKFEHDPQAVLAAHGLNNVSAQDVRDARLIMTDDGAVHHKHHGRSHHHHASDDDPVREIRHTTAQYEASEHEGHHHNTVGDVNQYFTFVNVDDRDTVIRDSFNTDNHGIDNTGGKISESVLAGDDINGKVGVDNHDDVHVTAINKSFNQDNSTDTHAVKVEDSFNKTTGTQPAPGSPAPDASTSHPDAPHASDPATDAPHANVPDAAVPADHPPVDGPADHPPVDGPVNQPPVDQSPADEHPMDLPPVEEPPADEPVVHDLGHDMPDDEPHHDLDPVHI